MHQLKLDAVCGDATNTNSTIDDDYDDDGFVDHDVHLRGIRRTPNSLDFNRKRKYASVKFQLPMKDDETLNEIIEECEYDSDIGKFNCKEQDFKDQEESESSNTPTPLSMVDNYFQVEHMNDLNSPLKCVNRNGLDTNNIADEIDADRVQYKIVATHIEFFESNGKSKDTQNSIQTQSAKETSAANIIPQSSRDDSCLSSILFAIFVLTVALLIIFPLPN